MKSLALLLSLLLLAGAAEAKKSEVIQFEDGQPVAMQEGYAYLLIRENMPINFVFVRELGPDELMTVAERLKQDRSFRPPDNVVEIMGRDRYSETAEESTYVLAVKPGTYIFGEQSFGYNGTCLCMGSVKFEAKAGVLTDLGQLLAARNDKPTAVPELANIVQQKVLSDDLIWIVMALRPATDATTVPEPLKGLPRVPAEYHAVNKFPNYFGAFADRLAPIPGILGYDAEGNVLDLRTGKSADSVAPR
jgi:hypothetical protein